VAAGGEDDPGARGAAVPGEAGVEFGGQGGGGDEDFEEGADVDGVGVVDEGGQDAEGPGDRAGLGVEGLLHEQVAVVGGEEGAAEGDVEGLQGVVGAVAAAGAGLADVHDEAWFEGLDVQQGGCATAQAAGAFEGAEAAGQAAAEGGGALFAEAAEGLPEPDPASQEAAAWLLLHEAISSASRIRASLPAHKPDAPARDTAHFSVTLRA
jgi:hypothetical protein